MLPILTIATQARGQEPPAGASIREAKRARLFAEKPDPPRELVRAVWRDSLSPSGRSARLSLFGEHVRLLHSAGMTTDGLDSLLWMAERGNDDALLDLIGSLKLMERDALRLGSLTADALRRLNAVPAATSQQNCISGYCAIFIHVQSKLYDNGTGWVKEANAVSAWNFDVQVQNTPASRTGTFYVDVANEPAFPWNVFIGTAVYNESPHVALSPGSPPYSWTYSVYTPNQESTGNSFTLVLGRDITGLPDDILDQYTKSVNVDVTSPIATVNALPLQSSSPFTVSWRSSDPGAGASGIRSVKVQYMQNGGPWTDVPNLGQASGSGSATLSGSAGSTYCFRAAATDNVQHVGTFPGGNGDTCTTISAPQCQLQLGGSPGQGGSVAILNGGSASGLCGRTEVVQASSNPRFRFDRWSDGSTQSTRSVTVNSNPTSLTALFRSQCLLQLSASPSSGGTAAVTSGGSDGDCGRSVSVAAAANSGYNFLGWSDGSAQITRPVTVGSDPTTLTANFQMAPSCTLTLLASPAAGGSASIASGQSTGPCGRTATVQASSTNSPSPGWQFRDWTDGTSANPSNPFTISVGTDVALTARFDPLVSVSAVGSGTVTPNGTSVCTFATTLNPTAAAAPGWSFVGWTENGQSVSPPFACDRPRALQANFAAVPCTVSLGSVPPAGGSTAIVSGAATEPCGRAVTLQATPNPNYRFGQWSDGSSQNPHTVTINSDSTLTASFVAQCTLVPAANPTGGGSVSISSGTLAGDCGRTATLLAAANPGYQFQSWSDGSTQPSLALAISQTAQTITANFQRVCTLTLGAAQNGSATVTSGGSAGACGRSVAVQATPNANYSFVQWSDGATQNPYAFALTADVTLTPSFSAIVGQCTLVLSQSTGGTAAFTSGQSTGVCNRSITVQAVPNSNFRFSAWSDGSTQNPYTLTVASNGTLSPVFVPQCSLSVAVTPAGSGRVSTASSSGTIDCGRQVTVTAIPTTGYAFQQWSDGATQNPYTLTVTADLLLTATFTQPVAQCTLSVTAGAGGGIAITSGSAAGACGRSVTVQAIANMGYRFGSWSDGATANPYTIAVSSDLSLAANFVAQCSLTVTAGAGGSATITTGGATGDCGRSVSIVASPNPGYTFGGWSDGFTANPRTLTLAADLALTASFQPIPVAQCSLTLSAGKGGAVSQTSGSAAGVCGRTVTIQATPDQGFRFVGWSDGRTANPYTFMLTTDVALSAAFVAAPVPQCALTLARVTGGVTTVSSGGASGDCGRVVSVTAAADNGYLFIAWSDGSTQNPHSFTLNTDLTLSATFQAKPQQTCTLALTSGAGGSATISSGAASGACGRTVAVQATPSSGFRFGRWSDGATANPHDVVVSAPTQSLSASFVAQCTLSVGAAVGGAVTVTTGGATGDCGRSMTVAATPTQGYAFQSWSDGATANPYTFSLDRDRALTASFTLSINATDVARRAVDELLGKSSLTDAERRFLDDQGNRDGVFNLGDLLALLDNNSSVVLSTAQMQQILRLRATSAGDAETLKRRMP